MWLQPKDEPECRFHFNSGAAFSTPTPSKKRSNSLKSFLGLGALNISPTATAVFPRDRQHVLLKPHVILRQPKAQ
jgi:hypothetical protein